MKLQNLSVIFIIIILPIILLVSYYISLQIDTINMQTAYNTKLLNSTKEAISSFEINTVQWNSDFAQVGDSKRRDILASINTFTTSFANNLGIPGSSKDEILAYVPAIAFTLYDGYYIYSPAQTPITIKNANGIDVVMSEKLKDHLTNPYTEENNGKLLYEYDSNIGGSPDGTYTDGTSFTFNQDYAKKDYSHILKPFNSYSARYKKR